MLFSLENLSANQGTSVYRTSSNAAYHSIIKKESEPIEAEQNVAYETLTTEAVEAEQNVAYETSVTTEPETQQNVAYEIVPMDSATHTELIYDCIN